MALVFADRVLETTTTTGTGDLTLAGAVTGFQTFAVIGNGNTCFYFVEAVNGNGVPTGDWESGVGTYSTTGPKLVRTTVRASSNSNAAVSFAAGTKRIGTTLISSAFLTTGDAKSIPYTDGSSRLDSFWLPADVAYTSFANVFLLAQYVEVTSGAAAATGLRLIPDAVAANNAQQWSPAVQLTGSGWSTTDSTWKYVEWDVYTKPIQGTQPTANLCFAYQLNQTGGFVEKASLTSAGAFTATSFAGDGSALTDLTASEITSGVVPMDLPLTGSIFPQNNVFGYKTKIISGLVNNGTAQLCNDAAAFGLVVIFDSGTGKMGMFLVQGSVHATVEVLDPAAFYTVTAGTATSANIYWSGANSRYEIENKIGSTRTFRIWELS